MRLPAEPRPHRLGPWRDLSAAGSSLDHSEPGPELERGNLLGGAFACPRELMRVVISRRCWSPELICQPDDLGCWA